MKRIALDMDAVLANIQPVAFALLEGDDHDRSTEEVESWSWGGNEYGTDRYLSALWHAWTLRPHDIDSCEPGLDSVTEQLWEKSTQLDIVTSHPDHPGIRTQKRKWLLKHNIEYDNFKSVTNKIPKSEFYYDVFIDDKPALARNIKGGQTLYLIDRPWNQDVSSSSNVYRVSTVAEALRLIDN